jgi:glutamyl-tRNA(Gln) amidotransferase subunit D
MSTGGTIASRVDYRTGAVRAAMSASDLYGVVPELADLARVDTEIVFSIYSENLRQQDWTELAKKVAQRIEEGVDGVVIGHGTVTMAYTSAALSFGAVKAAGEGQFAEVGLAMHETVSDTSIVVHRGVKVRKCHTSRRDTFKSVNGFPIAKVQDLKVTMVGGLYQKRDPKRKIVLKPNFSDKVALVKFHPGLDPAVIDFYVEKGFKGILLEGSGLGHVSKFCFEAIKRATAKGVVVALASQCIWGRVNMNVYDTGRDLQSFGVVPLEDMFPETGLVKLMWVLGQTDDPKEAIKLLKTNLASEYSPRTLPQEGTLHYEGGQ